VTCRGQSVLNYGDISCVSFHATKLFNTAEGGGCVTGERALAARLRRLRFFGFDEHKDVTDIGMNAKMTEVHAALGLANLRHLDSVRANRRRKYGLYSDRLGELAYLKLQQFDSGEYNYSYMPVLFDSEMRLLKAVKALAGRNIVPRRYFCPSLNTLQQFAPIMHLPVAEKVAKCILCLPLYDSLSEKEIDIVCECISGIE